MSRMHDPAHPGVVLREWFPEGMTVTEAAAQFGVSRVTLSKILNGRAGVTADMARAQATLAGRAWVPELMLRKKVLEALLKTGYPSGPYTLPDSLRGWRRALMGQALLDTLA